MQDLVTYYQSVVEFWEKSEQYGECVRFIEETILPLQTFECDQALCIAIGSFESAYDESRDSQVNESVGRRACFQLAAFETFIQLLRRRPKSQLEKGIYFQEPDFTPLDIKFLEDRGYSVVLSNPGGYDPFDETIQNMMTPKTFAFIPCGRFYTRLLFQSLKINHPSLMISTPIPPQRPEVREQSVNDPETEDALENQRRLISRPFFSSRLFCPLFEFTNHSKTLSGVYDEIRTSEKFFALDIGLQWADNPWIYWTPDNKSRLTKYTLNDDMADLDPVWENRTNIKWPKELTRAPSNISNSSGSEDEGPDLPPGQLRSKDLAREAEDAARILEDSHADCDRLWRTGSVSREIDRFFKETILPQKDLKIDRAICLCLGTFCYLYDFNNPYRETFPEAGNCIMTQFVAFEHWINLLRKAGHEIKNENIIFQDPAMSIHDEALIISRGYTFEGPTEVDRFNDLSQSQFQDRAKVNGAQKLTTSSTFAFIPCGTFTELIRQCLEVAHPALLISSPIELKRHGMGKTMDRDGSYLKNKDGSDWEQVWEHGYLKFMKKMYGEDDEVVREHLAERAITRPFYSEMLFRPLVVCSNYLPGPEGEYREGAAWEKVKSMSVTDSFAAHMWIYWRPDDGERLKRYAIEYDMPCTCIDCNAGDKEDGWWRDYLDPIYQEIEDDELGREGEGQEGVDWEPNSEDELGREGEYYGYQGQFDSKAGGGVGQEGLEAEVDEPAEAVMQPVPKKKKRRAFSRDTFFYFF